MPKVVLTICVTVVILLVVCALVQSIDHIVLESYTSPSVKVDVVFTWVDANDRKWLTQRAFYKGRHTRATPPNQYNVHTLLNAVLSVHHYMPWVNHIYIVTNGQIPPWLNGHNMKNVSVITHKSIFRDTLEDLPVFNSNAIECQIHNIPNLSEHFIYFNDDCIVQTPVDKRFFFTPKGAPITRYTPMHLNRQWVSMRQSRHGFFGPWERLRRCLVKSKLIVTHHRLPFISHHAAALKKSLFRECIQQFPDEFAVTRRSKFRNYRTIAPIGFVSYYSVFTGRSRLVHERTNVAYIRLDRSYREVKHTLEHVVAPLICLNRNIQTVRVYRLVKRFLTRHMLKMKDRDRRLSLTYI